jgi:hypothetical protein
MTIGIGLLAQAGKAPGLGPACPYGSRIRSPPSSQARAHHLSLAGIACSRSPARLLLLPPPPTLACPCTRNSLTSLAGCNKLTNSYTGSYKRAGISHVGNR